MRSWRQAVALPVVVMMSGALFAGQVAASPAAPRLAEQIGWGGAVSSTDAAGQPA